MNFKSIYRKYVSRLKNKPQKTRVRKQWIGEWIEIFTKERQAVSSGKLTQDEVNAIQTYWKKQGFGSIPLYWHRKYKAYSGKLDVRYFPEYYFTTQLEPLMNKDAITGVLSDKNLVELLYAKVLYANAWIRVPKQLGGCCNGNYFSSNREPISFDKLKESLSEICEGGEYIIKPSVGESSGHGVRLLLLENGIDQNTGESIAEVLKSYGKDFIVQERIIEHREWAAVNPSSINTVRVITYRVDDDIHATKSIMRIGRDGSHLDNAHAGGMYVAVKPDGRLGKYAYVYGFGNKYEFHPDTGIRFATHRIPGMDRVREAALKLHRCLPSVGFVNWDFVVDKDNNVILIEANLTCGSVWLIQNAHGEAVFGEDTPKMIRMICK